MFYERMISVKRHDKFFIYNLWIHIYKLDLYDYNL